MRITVDYDQLAQTMGRVLTTGPERLAQLAALPDPWAEDAPAPAIAAQPAPIPADKAAPDAPRVEQTLPKSSLAIAEKPERSEAPAAPTFSLPSLDDDDDEDTGSNRNMGHWIEQREREARAPFQPMFDEVCLRVKRGDFATQGAIAKAYNKSEPWARQLRAVAVKQNVFKNESEWWSCFPKKRKNGSTKLSTYDPQLTSRKPAVGGSPQLTRESFETVMLSERKLEFDVVVQMIRFRCWATVHDFCEHFRQTPAWAAALRSFAMREGLFTPETWSKCFGKDRRPVMKADSY